MKLFISYSRGDLERVSELVSLLRTGGHDPWFDQHLKPGQDWQKELGEAIDDCDVFIYALSKASVESEWCQWEFARAVRQGKPIVPALIRADMPFDILPAVLQGKHIANLTEITATGLASLLGGLNNLTVTIPPEDAPSAPAEPKGQPAQATPSEHQIKATVTRHHPSPPSNDADGDNPAVETMTVGVVLPRRYRWGITIIGVAIIIGAIVGTIALLPIGCDYLDIGCPASTETPTATQTQTITPTITLTYTPSRVPTNTPIPTETPLPQATSTLPPTACEATVLSQVLSPSEEDTVLNAIMAWQACQNVNQTLSTVFALNTVAGQHRSYLSSVNRNQLDTVNLYFNNDGQGVEELARIAQYDGAVEMIVLVQEGELSFADLLSEIRTRDIDISRYPELGINFELDPATGLHYLVVVFGNAE